MWSGRWAGGVGSSAQRSQRPLLNLRCTGAPRVDGGAGGGRVSVIYDQKATAVSTPVSTTNSISSFPPLRVIQSFGRPSLGATPSRTCRFPAATLHPRHTKLPRKPPPRPRREHVRRHWENSEHPPSSDTSSLLPQSLSHPPLVLQFNTPASLSPIQHTRPDTMAAKSALPSHLKPANGGADGFDSARHHGKSQSHVVSRRNL